MSYADDPKLTLDDAEWRQLKQATRQLRYRRRLEEATADNTMPWLAAVDRDDLADPVERELVDVTEPLAVGAVAEGLSEPPRDLLPKVLCGQL